MNSLLWLTPALAIGLVLLVLARVCYLIYTRTGYWTPMKPPKPPIVVVIPTLPAQEFKRMADLYWTELQTNPFRPEVKHLYRILRPQMSYAHYHTTDLGLEIAAHLLEVSPVEFEMGYFQWCAGYGHPMREATFFRADTYLESES